MSTQAQPSGKITLVTASTQLVSSTWIVGTIVPCAKARLASVVVDYLGAALASAGYCEIYPLGSVEDTAPAIGDRAWADLPALSGSVTTASLASGTLPTGFDNSSIASSFGRVTPLRLLTRMPLTYDAGQSGRQSFLFDVTGYQFFTCMFHEVGDTTHPGIIGADLLLVS